ncbi:VOC family protein [Sphingobacterium faecium]|uniref:VOC family protein n=1 Tax=Sphingobacterium faecium TaxID=34087 RepID=UPI003208ACE1
MGKSTLVSIRIITGDIKRLVQFFEDVTATTAKWATDDFAELVTNSFILAIGSTRTLAFFGEGVAQAATNKSVIIEFLVDNVDRDYERIQDLNCEIVQKPTTMPWGNRSLLFRDPDGNLINLFTPVSDEAKTKFASR